MTDHETVEALERAFFMLIQAVNMGDRAGAVRFWDKFKAIVDKWFVEGK